MTQFLLFADLPLAIKTDVILNFLERRLCKVFDELRDIRREMDFTESLPGVQSGSLEKQRERHSRLHAEAIEEARRIADLRDAKIERALRRAA